MRLIKYKGYWGNSADTVENEAMGLVPGKLYAVKQYTECCHGCGVLQPMVSNERGELILLISDEYAEVESD